MSPPVFYTDAGLATPVTATGAEPTAAALGHAPRRAVGDDQRITKSEAQAIQYFAGLGAEQSKTLAGIAVRLFGDLELSFVIGGHFSFGDNDTLAEVADTFFERSSRRLIESRAHRVLASQLGEHPRFQKILDIIKKVLD